MIKINATYDNPPAKASGVSKRNALQKADPSISQSPVV